MDYSPYLEVMELTDKEKVNSYLSLEDPRWDLIGVFGAQREDRSPYCLYVLGRYPSDKPPEYELWT